MYALSRMIGSLATLLLCALPNLANAADWPTRPVTLVVPFTAGSSTDVLSRFFAKDLGERLGQRIIIENRPGASGNIGTGIVAKAAPDGYTLVVGTPNPIVLSKLIGGVKQQFDPDKDLTPVIVMGSTPSIFVTSPKSAIHTLQDMIAVAKANPGKLNVAVPGLGTSSHLAMEWLNQLTDTKVTIVPYRGPPPLADIVNGQIDIAVNSTTGLVSMVTEGSLRPLAVSTLTRSSVVPNIPTVDELGFKGFEAATWYVLMAPAETPAPIIDRLNAAVNDFVKSAAGKKMFTQFSVEAGGGTPHVAKDYISREAAKWRPIVKTINF